MAQPTSPQIACRQERGILVIVLNLAEIRGDDTAEALRAQFLQAVEQYGGAKVVLDFAPVSFLTSTAFRPLISLHRKLQEKRGRMVFCNLAPQLAEVFFATRLISATRSAAPFELAVDVDDALARLQHHTSQTIGDVVVLKITENYLEGQDLAESLTEELPASVTRARANKVVVDLSAVERITTPCLKPLVTLRNQLRGKGGRVVLAGVRPLIAEALTATRLIGPAGSTG